MILITKEEARLVREKYPGIRIVRTCVQKSKRHKYYMPEDFKLLKLLTENNQAQELLKTRKRSQYMY